MATCVQTPTLTSTEVTISESLFPTSSVLTSTLPGSISTSSFLTCTQTNSSIPCRPTLTSSLVTIPGNVTLLTVPVTGTIDVPITNFVTLFGSSCSTTPTPPPTTQSTSTSSSSSSTSTSTSTSSSSSSLTPSFSISTPPPSLITSSTVFTSDGSTFVTVFTSTSTSSPTTIDTSSSGTGLPNNANDHSNAKKASNAGPIAGGVVGGLIALALLGLLTWKLIKKQPRFDDIFHNDTGPHYKKTSGQDPEPKPYNYGLVGQSTNPVGHGATPPSSPPPGHSSLGNDVGQQAGNTNDVGYQGGHGNDAGYHQGVHSNDAGYQGDQSNATGYQGGQSNATGYQGGHSNAAGYQGAHGNDAGYQGAHGNDVGYQGGNTNGVGYQGGNTNGIGLQSGNAVGHVPNQPPLQHLRNPSLTPLLAGIGVAAAAAGANAVTSSRPTSSRPSSSGSSQPSGPLVTNAEAQGYPPLPSSSYPPALQNWSGAQGYGSPATTNAQGYGSGPTMGGHSTGLSMGGSVNSIGSDPSTYSTSTSGGPSASGGTGVLYNPVMPGIMPVIATAGMRNNNNQNVLQQSHMSGGPFARSGSPVSIQERRTLQVINGEPSSPGYGTNQQVYDPNAYYLEASSSSSASAGPSSVGPQSVSSSAGVDGKGRPLNLQGEKAPLVHLDGGLYEESGARSTAAPAPPAYQA